MKLGLGLTTMATVHGRLHSVFLVQVKTPAESKGPDDLVKLVATIPGDKAFRPMSEGGCPYVKSASAQ